MIKVLVVDDSALMRREISKMLESDNSIQVVGTARDGSEVVSKVKELSPDVITLDVEMPKMDGLETLKQVMEQAPCPVVMVSSLTGEGADTTIQALENGAIDFVHKPSGSISLDIDKQKEQLISKIKTASQTTSGRLRRRTISPRIKKTETVVPPRRVMPGKMDPAHIVGIGISTGGPRALMEMLPNIAGDLNISILIVQHMPEKFTASLAKRLDKVCPMQVKEAEDGEIVERGCIYIAPGGKHMELTAKNPRIRFIQIVEGSESDINCPSVDRLFASLNHALAKNWLGVILTGMGGDGAEQLLQLKQKGGHTIAEAEETCTVFGMPKRAIEKGAAEFVLPLEAIPEKIHNLYHQKLF
ncbi:MAG: chemotaxis response regulator protein-glutamate methylesterase [SAR324 cluster bacterium]|nr:chemotaxis response regulator protein-glutamate methylesterase [SAR324 cluster bacterium]